MTNEDGLSAEQAEQHRLDVSQTDGGVFQILLRHTREPGTHKNRNISNYNTRLHQRSSAERGMEGGASSALTMKTKAEPAGVRATNSPGVIIHHFALRLDKSVVDDFHLRVDDRHPGQLQALLGVTLVRERESADATS